VKIEFLKRGKIEKSKGAVDLTDGHGMGDALSLYTLTYKIPLPRESCMIVTLLAILQRFCARQPGRIVFRPWMPLYSNHLSRLCRSSLVSHLAGRVKGSDMSRVRTWDWQSGCAWMRKHSVVTPRTHMRPWRLLSERLVCGVAGSTPVPRITPFYRGEDGAERHSGLPFPAFPIQRLSTCSRFFPIKRHNDDLVAHTDAFATAMLPQIILNGHYLIYKYPLRQ